MNHNINYIDIVLLWDLQTLGSKLGKVIIHQFAISPRFSYKLLVGTQKQHTVFNEI